MRQAFAHDAVLIMPEDANTQAPGAAITVALCGHWQHEPPCPLAPHHTRAERINGKVLLRTLFAAEPDQESTIRRRIDQALSRGHLPGTVDATTRWQLRTSRRGEVSGEEADRAERLARG
jgi:hypothetical protein